MANTKKKKVNSEMTPQDVKAVARYQRITPQKIERMLDVVRNKPASLALAQLDVLPHSAAVIVKNVLKSAMANATHNHNMKTDLLVVSRAVVGPAGMMKRMRAVSRGRGHLILKKLSHISIFVREKARPAVLASSGKDA